MTMAKQLVYEYPLNEHVRTLLRIENIFSNLKRYSSSTDALDMRLCINLLLGLNELLKMYDIKSELTRDLERRQSVLRTLEGKPGVDKYKLRHILTDLDGSIVSIRDSDNMASAALNTDELLTSIRQKHSLIGGACNFDLPAYQYWLNRPARARQQYLQKWQADLAGIQRGVELALKLLRGDATAKKETAEAGFFQQSTESDVSYQLIRIISAGELKCFPEVSGGKHRITVRFMEQEDTMKRPVQTEKDVEFTLHFCVS